MIVCPITDRISFVSKMLLGGFDLSNTFVGLLKLLRKNMNDIINGHADDLDDRDSHEGTTHVETVFAMLS